MTDTIPSTRVKGRVRAHSCIDEEFQPTTNWCPNLVVYEWSAIITKLLGLGETKYRIAGMLLEFENVASPGDSVAIPTFDRTRNISYYDNLVGSSDRDYMRVPLTAHTITSKDEVLFPKGNTITFFGRSQGLQGVHGKTFSDSVNSVVFGGSLVAFPDNSDSTQDLILSSFYFDAENQQPKISTSQLGLEWELEIQ